MLYYNQVLSRAFLGQTILASRCIPLIVGRKHSVRTLRSLCTAQFLGYCVQSEEIKIINFVQWESNSQPWRLQTDVVPLCLDGHDLLYLSRCEMEKGSRRQSKTIECLGISIKKDTRIKKEDSVCILLSVCGMKRKAKKKL